MSLFSYKSTEIFRRGEVILTSIEKLWIFDSVVKTPIYRQSALSIVQSFYRILRDTHKIGAKSVGVIKDQICGLGLQKLCFCGL